MTTDSNTQHWKVSPQSLKWMYKNKMITASGYLLAIIQTNRSEGWKWKIKPSEICEEWEIPERSFYRALSALRVMGIVQWQAKEEVIIWWENTNLSNDDETIHKSECECVDTSDQSVAVTLPSVAVTLPSVAVTLPSVAVTLPSVAVTLPSVAVALPEMLTTPSLWNSNNNITTFLTTFLTNKETPFTPQNFEGGGEDQALGETESVLEQTDVTITQTPEPSCTALSLPLEQKVPTRENGSQIQKSNRIKETFEQTGKVLNYGIEYQQWICVEMGDVIRHYRQSARALDRTPNDISLEFKSHVSLRANSGKGLDIHAVDRWIVNCEKDPDRWPELRSLVAGWLLTKQTGDRHLNIAQEVERSSRPPISLNLNF